MARQKFTNFATFTGLDHPFVWRDGTGARGRHDRFPQIALWTANYVYAK